MVTEVDYIGEDVVMRRQKLMRFIGDLVMWPLKLMRQDGES